jgi:hypothetical protein
MSIDAMKTALEALEFIGDAAGRNAIAALRLAIEQAEKQEPVAWWREDGSICVDESQASAHDIPLYTDRRLIPRDYTAPPQRQPLTDEEIDALLYEYEAAYAWHQFARAIERAHGII